MNYILMKIFPKDDYLGRLCYESWIRTNIENIQFLFFAEFGEYNWIKNLNNSKILYRNRFGENFGGIEGAKGIRYCVAKSKDFISINEEDNFFICDSDIILFHNPLLYIKPEYDSAAIGNEFFKTWGQLAGQNIFMKGNHFSKLSKLNDNEFNLIIQEMTNKNINICDDTFISYFLFKNNAKTQDLLKNDIELWTHHKLYRYKPRIDFDNIITEVRDNLTTRFNG